MEKDKPAPLVFASGWSIQPDLVVEMPLEFQLPATGTINYQFIRVKGNFTEDLWVEAAEMRLVEDLIEPILPLNQKVQAPFPVVNVEGEQERAAPPAASRNDC